MAADDDLNQGAPRIGIIGARKRFQGIGQYLARDLVAAGAEICAIVGTTVASVEQARATLFADYALEVEGYVDVSTMIAAQSLHAIVICSPHEFHRDHLAEALRANLHVLCEKPLVFDFARDNVADAERLIDGFATNSRVLMANQQWPYTLETFARCYPEIRRNRQVTRFEMLLAPAEDGISMIPDALPHAASMLLALGSVDGRAERVRCTRAESGELRVKFEYLHEDGAMEVQVCLVQVQQQPRPAAYAINGCTVARRIELPGYKMYLQPVDQTPCALARQAAQLTPGAAGCVSLEDPLRLLAADFIRRIKDPQISPHDFQCLLQNVRIVQQVYEAARQVLHH